MLTVLLQSVTCNKEPENAVWKNCNLEVVQVINDSANNYQYFELPEADTIILDQGRLGFVLGVSIEVLAQQNLNLSFVKTATATSLGPPRFIMENSIDSVNLFTLRSFDAQHPINSNVNDLLQVKYKQQFTSFQAIIDAEIILNTAYQEIDWGGYRFEMLLKQNPTDDSLVQLKSIVYFSNRKIAIDTSELVLIKN